MKRVSFDSHGGSKVKSLYVRKGALITDVNVSEKDGYEFVGWYADLNDEEPFDFDNTKIMKNMKLHAKWMKNV